MRKPKITGYAGKVRVCDDCWESFAPNHLHRKSTETSGRKDQTSPRHTEPRKLQAVDEHTAMLRLDDPNDRESYTQWNTSGIDLEKALSERRRDRKASLNTWWAYWRRICCFMCRSRQIVHAQPGCCSCCCADHGILHGMTLENDEEEVRIIPYGPRKPNFYTTHYFRIAIRRMSPRGIRATNAAHSIASNATSPSPNR
eukprot:1362805-Amorphochlora_amoeboformis.AAC.2